jgi:hypothetical protein
MDGMLANSNLKNTKKPIQSESPYLSRVASPRIATPSVRLKKRADFSPYYAQRKNFYFIY